MRYLIILALVTLAAPHALDAQTAARKDAEFTAAMAPFKPLVRPQLTVMPAPGQIVIDGELEDAGWRDAAVATGFSEFQPREGVAAEVHVEAWVTYTETHLYVAFRVEDDPSTIRASLRNRDQVFGDDLVGIVLDPFGNDARGYLIGSNALGVQLDMLLTPNSEDISFDLMYESAGRITETGYQVEMAIPFSSLQFPKGEAQEWRLNFLKIHPRSSMRQYAWGSLSRDNPCLLCQNGKLLGLEGIRAGSRVELLPAVVASHSGSLSNPSDPGSFSNGKAAGEVSLGVRYPFRSGWMMEATYNPDFSQVESDAAQIDVNTTFALSYPERRPFFQEGAELFQTNVSQVYTRAINSPIGAAKLIGREGRTSFGYIGAVDERTPILVPLEERTLFVGAGRSVSNIFRVHQSVGNGSHVGALITDRRYDGGGSGSTVGADARIRLGEQWQVTGQLVMSHTEEPESGDLSGSSLTFGDAQHTVAFDGETFAGWAGHLGVSRHGRHLGYGATVRSVSPTFRAADGFQSRNDFRTANAFVQGSVAPGAGLVDRISGGLQASHGWNFDGVMRERSVSPWINLQMKGQTWVNAGLRHGDDRFDGTVYSGLTSAWANANSSFSERLSVGGSVSGGDWIHRRFGAGQAGRGLAASTWLELRPTQRLVVSPSLAYQRMDDAQGEELFAGYIARANTTYQLTRELHARVVVQYNDFNEALSFEPLIMYRLNPLSVLYIGSTHGYGTFQDPHGFVQTERQIFLKLQYLFRP
jgi:hypothetical protein